MIMIETGPAGRRRSVDVMEIDRPGDLGEIGNLGLSLAEGKRLLARVQQEIVAAQVREHAFGTWSAGHAGAPGWRLAGRRPPSVGPPRRSAGPCWPAGRAARRARPGAAYRAAAPPPQPRSASRSRCRRGCRAAVGAGWPRGCARAPPCAVVTRSVDLPCGGSIPCEPAPRPANR